MDMIIPRLQLEELETKDINFFYDKALQRIF